MIKTDRTKYNYGECEICDSPVEEEYITQDMWIRGELIVIENVPAGVCPKCGEKVVNADVGRRIMALLENTEWIAEAPRISVPTIRFESEKATA